MGAPLLATATDLDVVDEEKNSVLLSTAAESNVLGDQWRVGAIWKPASGLTLDFGYSNLEPSEPDPLSATWSASGEEFDVGAGYEVVTGKAGRFSVFGQVSYLVRYREVYPPELSLLQLPDTRAKLGLDWKKGAFSGRVTGNYVDSSERPDFDLNAPLAMYDIEFGWHTPWFGEIRIGAKNLLDKSHGEDSLLTGALADQPELVGRVPYVRYQFDL